MLPVEEKMEKSQCSGFNSLGYVISHSFLGYACVSIKTEKVLKNNTSFLCICDKHGACRKPVTTAQLTSSKLTKLLGTYSLLMTAHQQCKLGSADSSEGSGNLGPLHSRDRVTSKWRCESQLFQSPIYQLLLPGSYPGHVHCEKSWKTVRKTPCNHVAERDLLPVSVPQALLVPGVAVAASPHTPMTNILTQTVKWAPAEGCLSPITRVSSSLSISSSGSVNSLRVILGAFSLWLTEPIISCSLSCWTWA